MIQFFDLLPDDVTVETFADFELASRHDDKIENKTILMINSLEALDLGQRKDINFGLRSAFTNMTEFVETTECKFSLRSTGSNRIIRLEFLKAYFISSKSLESNL